MSIPTDIASAVLGLQTAFTAAEPLADAPPLVYADVRDRARDLVGALDGAINAASADFDAFAIPAAIASTGAALIALHQQCADQSDLCALRALIGRVRTNVNLAQV